MTAVTTRFPTDLNVMRFIIWIHIIRLFDFKTIQQREINEMIYLLLSTLLEGEAVAMIQKLQLGYLRFIPNDQWVKHRADHRLIAVEGPL